MKRPIVLTNFVLFYLVVLVLLLFGLGIAFYPFDSAVELLIFLGLLIAINALGAVTAGIVQVKLISKDSIWLQPASEKVGRILINSVVLIWLCGIAFIIFVILKAKGSTGALVGVIVLLLMGAGLGRHLQKRFSSKSWLPYGISFFGALVAILVLVAAIGMRG